MPLLGGIRQRAARLRERPGRSDGVRAGNHGPPLESWMLRLWDRAKVSSREIQRGAAAALRAGTAQPSQLLEGMAKIGAEGTEGILAGLDRGLSDRATEFLVCKAHVPPSPEASVRGARRSQTACCPPHTVAGGSVPRQRIIARGTF